MPNHYTFPDLLDEVKQISITKLKEFGFMEPDSYKSGRLIWRRRGEQVGDINISADMREKPHIKLSYLYSKEEPVNYSINLVSIPSNLGIGKIWYFVCPNTGKRSRKLYGAGKYFLHRDAFPNAMYECQTYSKKGRQIDKICKIMHGSDKLYSELYSKHFKTHYAGKPTKRYKQIMSRLKEIESKESYCLKMFEMEMVS